MEHSPEATESETTELTPRPGDALARVSRFFRRPPAEEDPEQQTMEFGAVDFDGAPGGDRQLRPALWGGYDRAAVDARISELEDELDDLRAQLDPDRGVEEEIRQLSDETAEILRVAHGKADAMVKQAQAEAETLLAEAREQADGMIVQAQQRLGRIDQDTDVVWAERMRLTEDTRRLADQLRRVADSAAERFPPETEEPAPVPAPPTVAEPGPGADAGAPDGA
jgi:hypothetical protein